ncbi:MAG: hypothetical protein V1848_03325, partial [Candidatus Magasanikbacteria bacterium]
MRQENGARTMIGFPAQETPPPIDIEKIGEEKPNLSVIQGGKKTESEFLLEDILSELRKETSPEEKAPFVSEEDYSRIRPLLRDISKNPLAEQIHRNKFIGAVFEDPRDLDILFSEAESLAENKKIDTKMAKAVREREIEEFKHELKTKPLSPDDVSVIKQYALSGSPLAAEILRNHEKRDSQDKIA